MKNRKIVKASLLLLLILTLSSATATGTSLKVITWNVGGGPCHDRDRNMALYANEIRAKNADVIALQEVHLDQAYALASQLWYPKAYYVQFVWAQRCGNRYSNNFFDFGNAIISRFPIRAEGNPSEGGFGVNDDPKRAANGNPEYIRVAEASVQVTGGRWVRVYSAHLSGENGAADNAALQVQQTLTHIFWNDAFMPGQPYTILLGDFNTQPTSGACARPQAYDQYRLPYVQYGLLTQWWGPYRFIDAWTVKQRPNADTCGYTISNVSVPEPQTRYDYIFLRNNGNITVTNMERVRTQRRLTAHFPVYAELSF
ncbi:MAG TPA: endonuclease/exonuclease/phosphatase family protein [Pyrinomonadaceae bacterium]|nr:endonuclease/exonuclease/phosphatase family protein [Pyrinomonadaceae bacterium]